VRQTGLTEVKRELPFTGRVLLERCMETPPMADEAVLAGRVVDATGAPVAGAEVRVLWQNIRTTAAVSRPSNPRAAATTGTGLRMSQEGLAHTTDETGGFTFCGVPTDTRVELQAVLGERESRPVEVPIAIENETVVARVVLP
jgi:protocatechuate 3,4-dioxygenase beta subunit